MKNKLKYKYLVVYEHKDGCGRYIISRNRKINSVEDIRDTEELIAKDIEIESVYVAIVNFILLEKEWGFWEWFTAIAELLILLMLLVVAVTSAVFG